MFLDVLEFEIELFVRILVSTLCFQVAEEVAKVSGVTKVLLADNEAFKGFLPGNLDILFITLPFQ